MKPHPPKNALKFLRWFCREEYLEEIEGDLTELYEKHHEQSPARAKWKFIRSVIRYSINSIYQQGTIEAIFFFLIT